MSVLLVLLLSFPFYTLEAAPKRLPSSNALEEMVYYSADFINADLIQETAELKGNVKVIFDEYEVNAKRAKIYKRDNIIEVSGNVSIEGSDSFVQAESAVIDTKNQTAKIKNVRLQSGQLLLEAENIEQIDKETYVAHRASFTTCVTCPPGWRIKGRKITTNINKYIDIRGGRFQILNQSILPLPHLILPLNTRRKTGFIPPSIANPPGETGTQFAQPFFWAIDPHKDLTLSPMIYTSNELNKFNGVKLHTEYNQWLSSESYLKLNSAYMYDDSYLNINNQRQAIDRWFLHYNNFFVLPDKSIQKTQLTLLKEREYLNDFISEVYGRGEPALKNTFSLSKTFANNNFVSAEAVYYTNLLVEDPFDRTNNSIHRLPELHYSVTQRPVFWKQLLLKADAFYTYFHKNGSSYDRVSENALNTSLPKEISKTPGLFDPSKDLLRSGHRLRLEAELSLPFKISNLFDILPKLQLRDSFYNFLVEKSQIVPSSQDYDNFANSRYFEFSTSFRTELSKIYNEKYKHKIAPEILLKYGSSIARTRNPFFNSQGDLPYHRQFQAITDNEFFQFSHGVQFDYWDRFFRAEVVEFNLTNIIIKKNKQDSATYYDQPFYFKLSQSYDFRNARLAASPDPWGNLNATLKFQTRYLTSLTQSSYFYKSGQNNLTTRNTLNYLPGKFLELGYTDFITVDDKGLLTDNRTKNISLGLGWEFPSLKFSLHAAYSLIKKTHQGWRTHFVYTPRGNCWGLKLDLYELANTNRNDNIGYNLGLFFNFGESSNMRKSLDI